MMQQNLERNFLLYSLKKIKHLVYVIERANGLKIEPIMHLFFGGIKMFCQQCGTQIEDGLPYCTNCGARQIDIKKGEPQQQYAQPQQPVYVQQPQQGYAGQQYTATKTYHWQGVEPNPASVSFGEAIKLFFKNYVDFRGRSTKSEYWWAFLFNCILMIPIGILCSIFPPLGGLCELVLLFPGLSLGIRRLHDTGKHWYYMFMGLIPLAGPVILIIQYCKDSDDDNQWGAAPIKK